MRLRGHCNLHDAMCVLSQIVNDSRVLLGGGWPEMVMAKEIDALARKTRGKKSLAMEAFTRALLGIPTTIADNAGLDSAELISQLHVAHQNEGCIAAIDVIFGSVSTILRIAVIYHSQIFVLAVDLFLIIAFTLVIHSDFDIKHVSLKFKYKFVFISCSHFLIRLTP